MTDMDKDEKGMPEKISFAPVEGEAPVEFYVLDEATLRGIHYILVTDAAEGDGEALILADESAEADEESLYRIVDDDREMDAVALLFKDSLEDMGIGLE